MAPFRSSVLTLPSSKETSTVPFSTSAFEYSTPESLFSSPSTAALQWPQLMSGTFNVFSVIISPLLDDGELFYLLVGRLPYIIFTRRSRRALLTTVTEKSAIAAAASTGFRKPYSPRKGRRASGTVPPANSGYRNTCG